MDRLSRRRRGVRRRNPFGGPDGKCRDIQRLWLLRILLQSNESPSEIDRIPSVHLPALIAFLGLPPLSENPEDVRTREFSAVLARRLRQVEKRGVSRDEALVAGSRMFCERLSLSEVEAEIILFAAICKLENVFKEIAAHVAGSGSRSRLARFIGEVTGCDPAAVAAALGRDAPLVRMRIIKMVGDSRREQVDFIDIMDGLENVLLQEHAGADALLEYFFRRSPGPKLEVGDFPHMGERIDMLVRFLGAAARDGHTGVNVMLYGPPGTGKTELARLVAQTAGAALYEVRVSDDDDDGISGSRRFSAYQLCQRMLCRSRDSLVLFDECEDVFPCEEFGLFGIRRRSGSEKGFTNRLLEENPVPAIWISNAVGQIDPAFMRRFDMHVEVKPPPRTVRRNVIDKYVGDAPAGDAWRDRIATCAEVTPADIESASRVARMLGAEGPADFEKALEGILKDRLAARGERLVAPEPRIDAATYSLSYLNADCDLERLAASLGQSPSGTMLLYGPPGTGKTAFGHYLAGRLDKPVVFRRASEIFSKWVGGTERNIARMFAEARDENAVLILDEADSFLQDRRGAHRSWEVSHVNEMLTRMEEFPGLFVCSTNLIDNLDQASFRRFSLKVRFGYMTPAQAWAMFCKEIEISGTGAPFTNDVESLRREVASLATLTPGDFATARRKSRMLAAKPDPRGLLEMLASECRAKREPAVKTAGF